MSSPAAAAVAAAADADPARLALLSPIPLLTAGPRYRPRILYVASTRHSGGLEVASVRLADQLSRTQPHRQEILYACHPDHYVEAECRRLGIPTMPLTVRNSGDFAGARRLVEIVRRESIDILHVHSRRDYVIAALAVARMRRDPSLGPVPRLLMHLHLVRPLGSPAFLCGCFMAPLVDRVLAVSETVRNFVLRCHPQLEPRQVVVVPNAVDAPSFRRDEAHRASVRREWGIPELAPVIGMVGRLDTKGQEQVIRAVGELKGARPYLMLVGGEGEPGNTRRLMRRAQRCGIAERVLFCGAQSSIAPYLSAMDIFAHMPLDEAFGLAPAEAMASGLPVVASNVGGCGELIQHGRTGLLANPRKRRAIAEQIQCLIDSPDLRRNFGGQGASYIEGAYTAAVQLRVLTGIYEEVMRAGRCLMPR